MGAIFCATEGQKCNQLILLPSPFSPNSLSVVIKAQTHQSLLLGQVLSVLFTALKNLLLSERAQSIPDHPRKFTASSLSTNKSARQNERGALMRLLKLLRRLLAEPQIASLVLAVQP